MRVDRCDESRKNIIDRNISLSERKYTSEKLIGHYIKKIKRRKRVKNSYL